MYNNMVRTESIYCIDNRTHIYVYIDCQYFIGPHLKFDIFYYTIASSVFFSISIKIYSKSFSRFFSSLRDNESISMPL
jgi:hypothetical protein